MGLRGAAAAVVVETKGAGKPDQSRWPVIVPIGGLVAESRKAIQALLTPASHAAWHEFAAVNGVSVSGLIEAWAVDWAERTHSVVGDDAFALDEVDALARQARRIDAQRRSRSR